METTIASSGKKIQATVVCLLFTLTVAFVLVACALPSPSSTVEVNSAAEKTSTQPVVVQAITESSAPLLTPLGGSNATNSEYGLCGAGERILTGFFTDISGVNSPTQIIRTRTTSDGVRRFASVVTCLIKDVGWVSDSIEVVNGYENIIVFFDKFGKGHQYRIIVGGHYVRAWEPDRGDMVGSLNGVDIKPFSVQGWIDASSEEFLSRNSRQIGLDIYLDDTQGDLSEVFRQTYQFIDYYHQIEKALLSGEGYPDIVPDGFFVYATEAWFVQPE
ncbi:MAG: hypothetical protein NTZ74_03385 [Chloroflexi bacterium]|nr:hypothetical protein [Chloroflexota bacterium]